MLTALPRVLANCMPLQQGDKLPVMPADKTQAAETVVVSRQVC